MGYLEQVVIHQSIKASGKSNTTQGVTVAFTVRYPLRK